MPPAREGAVDPADRLDSDQIPEHEHVEGDLEPQLGFDLRRRMCGLARLVVLDDPARAERVEIDPVDLAREREAVDLQAALELGGGTLRAERDLEAARDQSEGRVGLLSDEVLEVAPEALLELPPLQLAELDPDAALDRRGQALAEKREALLQALGVDALDAESLRQPREELEESLMGDGAAEARIDLAVDRTRVHDP